MNLLVSIFGGMLFTAVLYGLGRLGRLSNFWAAVVAAGLPSFAYLFYAAARWPGLDVVTLHIVTYPTVAVLLSQLYGAKADHAKSLHWAPKLMIVFFVILSVVYGGLVYVAGSGLPPALARLLLPNVEGKNIHTGFAGVVEHHHEAAKVIGQHQKMEARLARRGWAVEAVGLSSAVAGQAGPVIIRLRDDKGLGVEGVEVSVTLARPGQGQGETLALTATGAGDYQGQLPALAAGSWVARISLRQAGEAIVLENTLSAN
jgi:nitrogen fixation protein FixH